jgi:hypothetical protein
MTVDEEDPHRKRAGGAATYIRDGPAARRLVPFAGLADNEGFGRFYNAPKHCFVKSLLQMRP